MIYDLVGALTFFGAAPLSQANNTGGFLRDTTNFVGKIAIVVNIGVKTVGDANGAITVFVQSSATNNISNAVNYGTAVVNTTNNAAALGEIAVDTRNLPGRYLFYGVTVTGTNSPAFPLSVLGVATKKVEP